jgi:hypothetical protein
MRAPLVAASPSGDPVNALAQMGRSAGHRR